MSFKGKSLLLITALVCGCTWIPARNASQGHVYPATSLITAAIKCEIPESAKQKDVHFLVKTLAVPQALVYTVMVELPFSLAIDTLLLPLDLLEDQKEPRKSVKYYCERMSKDTNKNNPQLKENHDNAKLAQ